MAASRHAAAVNQRHHKSYGDAKTRSKTSKKIANIATKIEKYYYKALC